MTYHSRQQSYVANGALSLSILPFHSGSYYIKRLFYTHTHRITSEIDVQQTFECAARFIRLNNNFSSISHEGDLGGKEGQHSTLIKIEASKTVIII